MNTTQANRTIRRREPHIVADCNKFQRTDNPTKIIRLRTAIKVENNALRVTPDSWATILAHKARLETIKAKLRNRAKQGVRFSK